MMVQIYQQKSRGFFQPPLLFEVFFVGKILTGWNFPASWHRKTSLEVKQDLNKPLISASGSKKDIWRHDLTWRHDPLAGHLGETG